MTGISGNARAVPENSCPGALTAGRHRKAQEGTERSRNRRNKNSTKEPRIKKEIKRVGYNLM